MQIWLNKPKTSTFTQKHAKIAFHSTLKQQMFHKMWKTSSSQNKSLQKTSN